MGEQSIARASKSGWVQPPLPSAVALGIASDLDPVAYFLRHAQNFSFFFFFVPVYNQGEKKSSWLTESQLLINTK